MKILARINLLNDDALIRTARVSGIDHISGQIGNFTDDPLGALHGGGS